MQNSIDIPIIIIINLTFATIALSVFAIFLFKSSNFITKLMFCYSVICLVFINIKWLFKIDLGAYDAQLYQNISTQISSKINIDIFNNYKEIYLPHSAYTIPLGLVYSIFGNYELIGQLLSAFFAMGVLYNLYRLADFWFDRKTANATALLVAFYVYGWILSAVLNRDILVLYFISLFFLKLTQIQFNVHSRGKLFTIIVAIFAFSYAVFLRPPLILIIGIALLTFLYRNKKSKFNGASLKVIKALAIFSVIVLGFIILYFEKDILSQFQVISKATQYSELDAINKRLQNSADANSAYLEKVNYLSVGDIIRYSPLALFYFMFAPLPWQINSSRMLLGFIDSLELMVIAYCFIKGYRHFSHGNKLMAKTLLVYLAIGFLSTSIMQANVGGAMRHRTMFYYMMFPVAAYGFLTRKKAPVLRARTTLPPHATGFP